MTLEEEFRKFIEEGSSEIEAKLQQANNALDEAVKLSEKHGIPFSVTLGISRQDYEPKSFDKKVRKSKKFKSLFEDYHDIIEELEVYGNAYGSGWSNSSNSC